SFLREFAQQNGKSVSSFSGEVLDVLMEYSWPGNVRELRTAVEHAVVLCRGEKITVRDLPPWVRNQAAASAPETQSQATQDPLNVKAAERDLIARALKESNGNRTLAAKKVGISRRNFYRKLKEYGLEGL
ncbi:MAG: helix-turn-helix domain-containing protein, partial [Limisphaerales bacterium]